MTEDEKINGVGFRVWKASFEGPKAIEVKIRTIEDLENLSNEYDGVELLVNFEERSIGVRDDWF